jgi:hypothetical protein
MQPYEITTRRITSYVARLAEIPADAPAALHAWMRHALFVPGARAELKPKIKRSRCWAGRAQ